VRLKTLEIKGFKSFADKTVVRFDKGVTGVIGPNGCGKSNIIDSIRWAIGEHKTSALRSEKMAGLIFNGSKSRAASGLAEVSLTFENTRNLLPTDFSTVTVNRRYFKNGDSEYRLNDVSCRLKDIRNLFLDTGISSDTYAIIELGMVDEIIKDKENSRRRMLEQAAGVSIYKTRKKEAQKKLKATQQDLDRIEDLLYEIEGNMKTLESQARRAERYFKYKKNYKTTSIELAKASMEGFHETFKRLSRNQQQQEDEKQELDTNIRKTDAEIESLKLEYTEKEKALRDLQQTFNTLRDQIREKENDKKLASQRLEYTKEQKGQIADFLSDADERLRDLKEAVAKREEEYEVEEDKLNKFQEQLEEQKELKEEVKAVYDEKREEKEEKRKAQQDYQKQRFDIEKKMVVSETSIQNLQQAIARLEDENAERKEGMSQQDEEKEVLQDKLEAEKDNLDLLIEKRDTAKENIFSAQSEIEELRARSIDKNRFLDAKKNEYDLLKSMVDNLEGYPESIKFLKKNKDWRIEAPVLSDIIFCDEEYRPAIEEILSPYLNYYVVDELEDAVSAIHLLDKNEKGKAHFFLLSQFNEEESVPEVKEELQSALDIVEVDQKYSPLITSLLKNVFIVDNFSGQMEGMLVHPEITLVEKSGKQYGGLGRIGGGSTGVFEGNKLGRTKSLEKLTKVIEETREETNRLTALMEEKREKVTNLNKDLNEQAIEATRDKINHWQNHILGLQNKFENTKALISSNENRLDEMREQLEDSHEKVQDYRAELTHFSQGNEDMQYALEQAEMDFAAAERKYNQVGSDFNDLNLHFMQQQSHLHSLKQENSFQKSRLEDLENQMTSNRSKMKKNNDSIQATEEIISKIEQELEDLAYRREDEQQKLNLSYQKFDQIKNDTGEKEKSLKMMQRKRTEIEEGLGLLREKVNDLKLKLAGMKERLDVEFQVDLNDILDEDREGEEPVDVLQAEAEKLKKRIENMGEVNPTAIEAFEEIKTRHDFIATQKEDLVEARDRLENTIKEVENTANQKFLDTFNLVKENFIKVFKTLFSEADEADMFLSNPDDISNTGVEIVAKPKGKRPAVITQLSGGEKTLTAIALLFAIYLIKPAPFCILDEVDAPLDDANVGKFTNMIREFSEKSQFIVITHNKQTMAAVDVIYGVTMQEAGVSKLVPVDFRSLEVNN